MDRLLDLYRTGSLERYLLVAFPMDSEGPIFLITVVQSSFIDSKDDSKSFIEDYSHFTVPKCFLDHYNPSAN